jgi:hypothetical protein
LRVGLERNVLIEERRRERGRAPAVSAGENSASGKEGN